MPQLTSFSGDGTLSVIDVRSKKPEPIAQSEDQEDELLSIVPIKGYATDAFTVWLSRTDTHICRGQKFAVGTQLGILSIFNRRSGWGDCVDRIPGHPHSIDTLAPLPTAYSPSETTILTGSSDGLLRAVQLFPTKLLGVVADHGEFPIERIAVDRGGEGRWVGSAGHEEVLKLTDLEEVFGDDDNEDGEEEQAAERADGENSEDDDSDGEEDSSEEADGPGIPPVSPRKQPEPEPEEPEPVPTTQAEAEADSSDDEGVVAQKRKRKKEIDPLQAAKRSKGRNEVVAEPSFFADL